jgi:hypothetical protein
MYPRAKRLLIVAATIALLASTALAAYIYQGLRESYDKLEQRTAVIEAIRFTQTGRGGYHTRMRTLVVTMRPLNNPHAESQEVTTSAPIEKAAEYAQQHRPGEVVTVWVYRRSGWIDDVMQPAPPVFRRIFLLCLLPVGVLTFFIAMGIVAHLEQDPD